MEIVHHVRTEKDKNCKYPKAQFIALKNTIPKLSAIEKLNVTFTLLIIFKQLFI